MQYNKYGGKKIFFKKVKMRLSCIGAVITRYLSPLSSEDKKDNYGQKKIHTALFYTIISFLLGFSRLSMGIYPFGISALISSYGNMSLYTFLGSAFSTFFQGFKGIIQFITFFLIFLIRKNLTMGQFKEGIKARLLTSFISSVFLATCSLFYDKIDAQKILAVITYIILSVSCTYLYSIVFCKRSSSYSNSIFFISITAVCVSIIPALTRLSSRNLDISLIFACLSSLWISKSKGPIYGSLFGFIMGFACKNPLYSAPIGLASLISGFLFIKSKTAACIAFTLAGTFCGIYVFGISQIPMFILHTVSSTLIFYIIRNRIPDIFEVKTKKKTNNRDKDTSMKEFEKVSDSLSGLSSVIYKFAEHLKSPSNFETGAVFDSAFSNICSNCSLNNMCYAKKECNFPSVRSQTISLLHEGPLVEHKLSKMLLDKCIRVKELCDEINSSYSNLNFMTMKSNRTQTVASLYNSMSHLIKSTTKSESENKERDKHLENSINHALTRIGIEFTGVSVKGTRCKEIFVHGVRADKIPCTSKELSDYLSAECRTRISEPEFDISDSADLVMKFTRGEIITLEYAQCCESKNQHDVSGDTICLFSTDKSYFYSIIADGMGSGKTAAATSRLSCVFLEKMLSSGSSKNVCLELLNNLLLSKNDETFSTVDLLEIDKLSSSAYFIKAGAAPSFVLRKNHLYKIFSETPPVGIIPSFSAESTRFGLEKGDVIFMVSDGVIQSDADAVWLSEIIGSDIKYEPAYLAKKLIEHSGNITGRSDDATACVIKVI